MSDFIVNYEGYTVVYTDGACINNGRGGARAGIGVWFRGGNPYNLSEPVKGRATNNNAEIQAITAAANQADKAGIEYLSIWTDSEFAINCATKWLNKWKRNNWRRPNGKPVINKEELQDMDQALSQLRKVEFIHVKGHQGNFGNKEADRLAREACELYQPYQVCFTGYASVSHCSYDSSSSSDDYY